MIIHCQYSKLVPIQELKPHPKNRNDHPDDQIDRLVEILKYQGWRYPVKVSNQSGYITSGHGRVMAAKKMGLKEVPVSYQDYKDEAQEYADIIADNAIASWSELNLSAINDDIPDLGPDFNIDLLGIKGFEIDPSEKGEKESLYTEKIEIPNYVPNGPCPKISELFDLEKCQKLLNEIKEKNLSDDIRLFLEFASYRLIVFNYEKIAEFYAHASIEVQDLMENSALVIIDFNKAIENGFVMLSKKLSQEYLSEED